MKNKKNHEIELATDESEKDHIRDHYHSTHHIYNGGAEDDVEDADFSPRHFFRLNKNNLTFNIAATATFLALSIAASVIDIFFEYINELIPPVNGIIVTFRYLDILVVMMAVSAIGPVFAGIVAFVTPWLHALVHSEMANPFQPLFDSVGYYILVWVLWFVYYVVARNSKYHRHPSRQVDLIRRWTPMVPFVIIMSVIFTGFYMLTIYITMSHNIEPDEMVEWGVFSKMAVINFFIVFGGNVIRFSLDYLFFALIEPKLKIINHKYR